MLTIKINLNEGILYKFTEKTRVFLTKRNCPAEKANVLCSIGSARLFLCWVSPPEMFCYWADYSWERSLPVSEPAFPALQCRVCCG